MNLAPLPVVIPLLVAAILAALSQVLPRRLTDLISILTSLTTLAIAMLLAKATQHAPLIYWFGNWQPDPQHFPIGIGFAIDPLAAGMSAFVSFLVSLALLFTSTRLKVNKTLFHVMMLVFLAAMNGLCLTGDLFNLFVWFELMTATAVALCGYKSYETGPLQGALNFAVTNTVGAFLTLTGIAFLYAFTGSLNFAGISHALATHPPQPVFLALAFTFVTAGFLVKAAAFPFHFWLADAHAVAPTPVCMLFSGVMVELGLYAVARIYFGIFSPAMDSHIHAVRALFFTVGSITALVGGLECLAQHHLKRLLAFSTISHAGLMLTALALLDPASFTGFLIYLFSHGLLKAGLFGGAGILLHQHGSLDESYLYNKAHDAKPLGVLMIIAALGLLSLPPFGTFFADSFIHHAAEEHHKSWMTWLFIAAGTLTAAAILRFTLRAFFGLDHKPEPVKETPKTEHRETNTPPTYTPVTLWLPVFLAVLFSFAPALWPAGRMRAYQHAEGMISSRIFMNTVLANAPAPLPEERPEPPHQYWPSLVALVLTAVLTAISLSPKRYPAFLPMLWHPIHSFQSGRVTDYVAWLTLGLAAWGALLVFQVR